MRVLLPLVVIGPLAGCAALLGAEPRRTPVSPAEVARPEPDPASRYSSQSQSLAPAPVEQVAVRAHRGADGRSVILEFLNPALTEAQRRSLRVAFEQGRLRLEREGGADEGSWTTVLVPPAP